MAEDLLIYSILEIRRFSPLSNISGSTAEHTVQCSIMSVGESEQGKLRHLSDVPSFER